MNAPQQNAQRHDRAEATDVDATNAYRSLAETVGHDDPRWAFGSDANSAAEVPGGAAIDSPLPDGVDAADVAQYCLMLGDDALICSQRLAEWVSNAPELEEDVALANIALDLLGQARLLLARAGHLYAGVGSAGRVERWCSEDGLAYLRTEAEFRNVALAELPDGLDFARTIARLLIFSTWRLALLQRLLGSRDPVVAAVADKGVKELTYHRDHAARWTLRLGDGTAHSRDRMQAGIDAVWPYLEELFGASDVERRLVAAGVAVDPTQTRAEVDAVLDEVLARATLTRPVIAPVGRVGGRGGRSGVHTEHFGHLLALMQSLGRQHPGATW